MSKTEGKLTTADYLSISDLEIIAKDRVPKFKCPKCWGDARTYNEGICECFKCSHSWELTDDTGRYVLTSLPFFKENEIGFECYNPDNYGATYIPEHIYIAHTSSKPKVKQIYMPIRWPESQIYLDWEHTNKKKFARCDYINPASEYGVNALWVPKLLICK